LSTNFPGDKKYPWRLRYPKIKEDGYPPSSGLVNAFQDVPDGAADAIVLRGYAGRSTIVERAREFLDIARRNGDKQADIDKVNKLLDPLEGPAGEILRIYLSPRLDRYVDFHRSCLITWRYEAKAERQDTITVWLRPSDPQGIPIPYRVVHESRTGPSFAAYLGGALLDDYLGQPDSQSSAWGTQAGLYGGGGKYTTARCAD
jgi:hypothetical protein